MDGQNDNLNDPNVVAVPSPIGATSGLHDPNVVAVPPEGVPQGDGHAHTGASSADIFHANPNDPWYERAGKGLVNASANALSGAGGGVIDTATGVLQGAPKMAPMGILANAVAPHAVGAVEDAVGKFKDQYGGVQDTGVSGMIGYGGESLLEFLASDGAMQGLSLGKKLEAVSGITKVLEQSPRTMGAVRLGALIAKVLEHAGINTLQASTIAGLQTYLKSGGDLGKSVNDFIHTAEFAGPFSAVAGAAGEVGGYLGRTAKSYQRLEQAVSTATPKEEVVKDMSQRLNVAEKQMHDEYQSGFEDIADRTQGQTVSSTHTPLAQAASEILANPKPDVNPFVASLERKVGETLDPKVKELLTELSTGVSADDAKAYEEAQRTASRPVNTGVVGANGQPITRAAEVPTAPTPHEYTGQELVQIRQTIRKLSESFDYGNINSRVLRSLISSYGDRVSPLDNTLGQLAGQTGDDDLVNDYMKMRKTYMEKHSAFDSPVLDKLREGKVGDAAKDFVNITRSGAATPTTGKAAINLRDLRTVLGDDGVKTFGKQVFGTVMRDSTTDKGAFDPDKFIYTMSRFDPETLSQLVDVQDEKNGMAALMSDAHAASVLQKLVRGGVLSGFGVVGGAFPHVGLGTLIGMTAGEGGGMGGIAKGRALLDWVALHPVTWKLFAKAGNLAEGPAGKRLASTVRYGGGKAVGAVMDQAQQDQEQPSAAPGVYGGLQSSLGGTQ